MAWVIRGGRAYQYRTTRQGGKVACRYEAALPAADVGLLRELTAAGRSRREMEHAAWEAERRRLEEAERHAIEADAAYDGLATAALVAAGYHRPGRDKWRRRRTMANKIQAKPKGPPPVTGAEMGAILDRVDAAGERKRGVPEDVWEGPVRALLRAAQDGDDRAMPALRVLLDRRPACFTIHPFGDTAIQEAARLAAPDGDLLEREVIARQIAAMRDELTGPGASPLERALAERVALAWYDAHRVEMDYAAQEQAGVSPAKAEFLSRQRSRAQSRFLAAAKSLATVRRLALPVLHLHRDVTPPAPVAAPEDRLRVLAGDAN